MSTEIDMIAGAQNQDSQGEVLDIKGCDISILEAGQGYFNDNHSNRLPDVLGRITFAKKIFGPEDCDDDRQKYYYNKVKAPYIYVKGMLFDSLGDHRSAKAAAAILRHQHRDDTPLKLKSSVEGGIIERGDKDESLLKRTKLKGVALTYVPANSATLVEGINLSKSANPESDMLLIKSLTHLVQFNVPSFIEVADMMTENIIRRNVENIRDRVVSFKKNLTKSLTAGFGGGAPTDATGGQVLQSESIDSGRNDKYITCPGCNKEQAYMKYQTKCRSCDKAFPMDTLVDCFLNKSLKPKTQWYAKKIGDSRYYKVKDIVDSKKGFNNYHLENHDEPIHQKNIEDYVTEDELNKKIRE